MTTIEGQFSSISHVLVHFTQDDLHRLASDSIDIDDLFETPSKDDLVPDSLSALRRATVDILSVACTRTTKPTRIKTLVAELSYSWKDKSGNSIRIRNDKKLEECFQLAIAAQMTKLVLHAHCDLLYFAQDFDGLNLDKADTGPFPLPTTAPGLGSATATASTPALATGPPTDIFNNYKSLISQVRTRYNEHQDSKIVTRAQDIMRPHSLDHETLNFQSDEDSDRGFPQVYMHHYNGGHMSRTKGMTRLNRNGVKPSRFKLIPLEFKIVRLDDAETTGYKPIPLSAPIQTRSEYVSLLAAAAMAGQKVAIQDDCGIYLSCRTKFAFTNSAFAEYRKTIGEYERFQVKYCLAQGTYSFMSHNGLYLQFNKQMGTIAFQSRTIEEAAWMVHPLGLGGAAGGRNCEHVVFCGVADKNGEFSIQRTTEGVGPEWKTDLEQIIETIVQDLPDGSSSIFQHPVTNHQWCVAKYDAEKIAIVVSSEQFPQALAVECHDDLTLLYKNSRDPKNFERIKKQGLDKDRIIGKDLAGLMMEYDERYYIATRNSKLSEVEQELQELQNKMGETIQQLQSKVEDGELLVSKTNELLEMSKLFKIQTEKLPTGWKQATSLVGTGVDAGTVALAGWFIGEPGCDMVLSTQGLEIGAEHYSAGILGGSVASTTTVSFWSRRFVKFIFPSKSR